MVQIRDESGRLERVEAGFRPESVGFSLGSIREIEEFKLGLSAQLRSLSAERAAAEHRRSVTDEDVRESLRGAVERLLAEYGAASRG